MSYQVLARKYRPRTFTEMVGQEHVLRALINGLDHDRLHHAYLFTGTRGVGKTTVARVLAKCLNCEQGISGTPCGTCGACLEIDEGRFVDLIEVDAASRTRVEDTRDLLDNVQYAPSRGRYKIYLVDEVHMLSSHSFNALLKTLEEPPPHVKFLLATTDPQRLPMTVLSRCLQFNLKRLPASLIAAHLARVLGEEGVDHEERAVQRLALAADGSIRDALSLTDQGIAFGGGSVRDEDVRTMLGSIEDDHVLELLEALASTDSAAVLEAVERLAERAPDFADVLAALLSTLHMLALDQAIPGSMDGDHPDVDRLRALSARLSPEDVQLFYQIALTGRRDLPMSPDPRLGFEMVLLRMLAFRPVGTAPPPVSAEPERHGRGAVEQPSARARADSGPPRSQAQQSVGANSGHEVQPVAGPATGASGRESPANRVEDDGIPPWQELLAQLELSGMSQALAMHCAWGGLENGVVRLLLDQAHAHLRSPPLEERIRQALERRLGKPVRLRIEAVEADDGGGKTPAAQAGAARRRRQQEAEEAIASDPTVSALQEMFDAEVVPDSVQPAK